MAGTQTSSPFVNPRDESFISRVSDEQQRQVMTDSVVRYRRADRLGPGDRLPVLPLTRLSDDETVQTTDLPANRPLVLIFGSYT
jgi:hypothetical protein